MIQNKNLLFCMWSNRHPKDVLRSFSHELVHHAQNCRGDLDDMTTQGHYAKEWNKVEKLKKKPTYKAIYVLEIMKIKRNSQEKTQMNEHYSIAKEEFKKIFAETVKAVLDEKKNQKRRKRNFLILQEMARLQRQIS